MEIKSLDGWEQIECRKIVVVGKTRYTLIVKQRASGWNCFLYGKPDSDFRQGAGTQLWVSKDSWPSLIEAQEILLNVLNGFTANPADMAL
jgi:hypothetical protein